MPDNILVIRLGALGDLTLCFQAFADIRAAHPHAKIALLTMPAFADFARSMPWFDQVLLDNRAPLSDFAAWWQLRQSITAFYPARVYDLQGKLRQSLLFYTLGGPIFGPEWSGAAPGCTFPRLWPPQPDMHYTDFVAAQLQRAGIKTGTPCDLSWLDAAIDHYLIALSSVSGGQREKQFILLIPGCSPQHPYKRWPPGHFAVLANHFLNLGYASMAVGTQQDADAIAAIKKDAPHLVDLSGKTSLQEVAGLSRRAAFVIGNDTGPTHVAATVGGKVLALMSDQVNPIWSAPKGARAQWLQGCPLSSLSVQQVLGKLQV